jgi:O-antigen/teichoic acid export membrane protein
MRGRIEERAARISLVNGLSTALTLAFQLVSVPICLKYWGNGAYGSWLALLSAFTILRSFDGGFITYVGNELNSLYHKDQRRLRLHLASAMHGVVVIGAIQVGIVGFTFAFEPLARLLGVAHDAVGRQSQLGLLVLMASWALTGSYLGIVHRLFIPAGMMYQSAWWGMAFQVAQFVAIIAAALLRLDMLETSGLFAAVQIVIYGASAVYVRRVLPDFLPWLRGGSRGVGLRDLLKSSLLTGSSIIQQGSVGAIVLVIAAVAGPVAVPAFTTLRTLANLWTSVTTVLTTPLLPEVVRIHAKDETSKLAAINSAYWVSVGSAVNLGTLMTYPLIPFFYAHWTGHAVVLNDALLCLLLATVVVANAGGLMTLHLNGINSLRLMLQAALLRASMSLLVGYFGYRHWGVASFGFGIFAGEVTATAITARHFLKFELAAKGVRMPLGGAGALALGTGSTLAFFIAGGLGVHFGPAAWGLALAGAAGGAIWGWRNLEPELRARLSGLALRWLPLPGSLRHSGRRL